MVAMWLVLLLLGLVTRAGATTVSPLATQQQHCLKAPPHAQPADANYRLGVAGDPDLFLPGELYTVSLQGVDSGQGPTPFLGFSIWVELVGTESSTQSPINQSLGTFQAYDAQAKLHEFCIPAVDNATAHPKTEIQVIWNAPLSAVEVCVRLCGKVSSVDGKGMSMLARKICAAPTAPASITRQPPIVEPCCACDEAKYEVTFEGLWSRNTHSRDFPPESSRAHFGDVIGASHTAQYRVWQEGRVASPGMRRLADDGATTSLEKELKAESDHIRTIIKARGISWQQVAGGAGHPSTFAVFRVDAKHHLISLAAKLAPSPDWIVGVSALELCNLNCTWTRSATLPLYPYDAGTDSGLTYISSRQPTIPAAPVRALRPDWPRDVRSPFFSNTGEMRAFARLRLNRLRLYEKNCDGSGKSRHFIESPGEVIAESGGGACAVLAWGPWGACSVSCGEGRAARQRRYMWPARAYAEACRLPLTDYRRCYGPRRHCRAVTEYEPDPAESTGPCAVSEWSEWSPCEGCGVRARTRHYLVPRAHKRCHVGYRTRTLMSQAMPCDAGLCHRPSGVLANSTDWSWFYVDLPRGDCPVSPWSDWGPCSAACGRGRRLRTRMFLSKDSRVQHQLSHRLLRDWNVHFAELQQLELPPENITIEDPDLERLVQDQLEQCQSTLSQQEALCDGVDGSCLNAEVAPEVCKLPMTVGHCRTYEERWFYDADSGKCEPFGFSGCGGNANNFRSQKDCQRGCYNDASTPTASSPISNQSPTKKTKPVQQNADNEVMQNDSPFPERDVDCETGPWLGWSGCFGDCDYAMKLNYRLVTREPSGSGRQCPKLVRSRVCRLPDCHRTQGGGPDSGAELISVGKADEVE